MTGASLVTVGTQKLLDPCFSPKFFRIVCLRPVSAPSVSCSSTSRLEPWTGEGSDLSGAGGDDDDVDDDDDWDLPPESPSLLACPGRKCAERRIKRSVAGRSIALEGRLR